MTQKNKVTPDPPSSKALKTKQSPKEKAKQKALKTKQKEKEKKLKEKAYKKEIELRKKIREKKKKSDKRGLAVLEQSELKLRKKRLLGVELKREKTKENARARKVTKGMKYARDNKSSIKWVHKLKSENMSLESKTYKVLLKVIYADGATRNAIITSDAWEEVKTLKACTITMYEQNGIDAIEVYGEHVKAVDVQKAIAYDL